MIENKIHLAQNIFFDTVTGHLQEQLPVDTAAIDVELGDGTGLATFGCLAESNGKLKDFAVFPAIVSCGDDRANGQSVSTIEDLKALFNS